MAERGGPGGKKEEVSGMEEFLLTEIRRLLLRFPDDAEGKKAKWVAGIEDIAKYPSSVDKVSFLKDTLAIIKDGLGIKK